MIEIKVKEVCTLKKIMLHTLLVLHKVFKQFVKGSEGNISQRQSSQSNPSNPRSCTKSGYSNLQFLIY